VNPFAFTVVVLVAVIVPPGVMVLLAIGMAKGAEQGEMLRPILQAHPAEVRRSLQKYNALISAFFTLGLLLGLPGLIPALKGQSRMPLVLLICPVIQWTALWGMWSAQKAKRREIERLVAFFGPEAKPEPGRVVE